MALFLKNKCCKLVCISAIALTSLSSCMKDDITGCPTAKLSLKFDYTYNVKEADAFSAEVKNLNVYVFDKNGKCEVDSEMECGWERIYRRLKEIGRLDALKCPTQIHNFATDDELK